MGVTKNKKVQKQKKVNPFELKFNKSKHDVSSSFFPKYLVSADSWSEERRTGWSPDCFEKTSL